MKSLSQIVELGRRPISHDPTTRSSRADLTLPTTGDQTTLIRALNPQVFRNLPPGNSNLVKNQETDVI